MPKLDFKGIDANLLTAIRGITMAVIVAIAALSFGKLNTQALASLSGRQWLFVLLSGVGGALSWIFFYHALASGPLISVTVIDKLSLVLTALLAILFLNEAVTLQVILGLVLVMIGTLLVSVPWERIISLIK